MGIRINIQNAIIQTHDVHLQNSSSFPTMAYDLPRHEFLTIFTKHEFLSVEQVSNMIIK